LFIPPAGAQQTSVACRSYGRARLVKDSTSLNRIASKGVGKGQMLPTRTLSVPAFVDSVPSVSEDADFIESVGMRKETQNDAPILLHAFVGVPRGPCISGMPHPARH